MLRHHRSAWSACFVVLFIGCSGPLHKPLPPESNVQPSALFRAPLRQFDVLSPFGPRGSRYHTGIDIRGHRGGGDPVLASRSGRVTRAQTMSGYGLLVEIK